MHPLLLHNGEIRNTTDALLSPGQVGFLNGWGIFSTLRVSQGVLFAFERHYARMRRDALLMRVPFEISADELYRTLLELVAANGAYDATLRLAFVRNKGNIFESPRMNRDTDLIAFTAPLASWGGEVRLYYVPHGRHAASPFAGTKVTSWAQNLAWYEEAHAHGFDEVILLNEHDQVSECTSANIFAFKGDRVFTPPLKTSGCLAGVTRAILLEELEIPGLTFGECDLTPADLESSDQVFITSTTRDVLPVTEIERKPIHRNQDALGRLQQAFLEYRESYVALHTRRQEVFI